MLHPLVELSSLTNPTRAQHPIAQQAIVAVTRSLQARLRGDHWPLSFQIPGLAFCALARDRALIADDQGLGKTTIALLRIFLGGHLPAIIVCPSVVSEKWRTEIGWWMPDVPVLMVSGQSTPIPSKWGGILIVTWDLLPLHVEALMAVRPRIVVGDEVQKAINVDAYRSGALDELVSVAPHLLLLSGTPITNHAEELWRLLHLIDSRSWPEVTKRAFQSLNADAFDVCVQTALTQRVRQFMLRRMKEQAMPELRSKQVEIVPVTLSPAAMRGYLKIEKSFGKWLRARVERQLVAEGYDLDSDEAREEIDARLAAPLAAEALAKVNHLRQFVGRQKVSFAVNWLADTVREGEAVIGFAHHKPVLLATLRGLADRGIQAAILDGSLSAKKRDQLVIDFQAGALDVLLCSMAAEAGVTLTRARQVLLIERFWTARTEDQMVDRTHRIGQTRDVRVTKLCATGTIDERMETIVKRKRSVAARTVDGERSA